MSFKKVVMFITSDGKQHKDEVAAKTHEVILDAKNDLCVLLQESLSTARVDSILNQIIMECNSIRDVLARMSRRLPRNKKEDVAA